MWNSVTHLLSQVADTTTVIVIGLVALVTGLLRKIRNGLIILAVGLTSLSDRLTEIRLAQRCAAIDGRPASSGREDGRCRNSPDLRQRQRRRPCSVAHDRAE